MLSEISDLESKIRECMSTILFEQLNSFKQKQGKGPPEKKFLRVSEACELLNICRKTLYTRTKEGLYKSYKSGRTVYYDKEELHAAIKGSL